jgi:hypothetical protein
MPQERTGYALEFEKFGTPDDLFGCAAIVTWDSRTFGFPVAEFRIGAETIQGRHVELLCGDLSAWLRHNQVSLCSCAIPAGNRFWKALLPRMGFQFVDLGLQVSFNGLQKARLQPARSTLRPAEAGDREAIEAIAEQAFRHGRYHADPVFPRELADRRYRNWMSNALNGANPVERIYVMGEPGTVQGFYHLTVEGDASDLRLAAIVPALQGTLLGFELYLAMLHTLKALGVSRVATSLSATNTGVMNVFSLLGFQFGEPELIYHWHAPASQVSTP